MGDVLIVFSVLFFFVVFFVVMAVTVLLRNLRQKHLKKPGSPGGPRPPAPQNRGRQTFRYDRQAHAIHQRDREAERQRQREQLDSLYRAGMMERDEYRDRLEALEKRYR